MVMFKHKHMVMFATNFSENHENQEGWSRIDTGCYSSTHNSISCCAILYA